MPRELGEMMMAAMPTTPAALAPPPSPAGPSRLISIIASIFPGREPTDIMVKGLLLAWIVLRKLQVIFGTMRRGSGSWLIQYGAMAAYYFPTPLLFYASGTVYSSASPNKSQLAAYCSCFLMLSAYGPTVMTANTLGDGSGLLQRGHLLYWLLYLLWMQFEFFKKGQKLELSTLIYFISVYLIPVANALCMSFRKSHVAKLEYETKAFADYMPQLVLKLRSTSGSSLFVHGVDDDNNSLQQGCEEYPCWGKAGGTWATVKDLPRQDQDTFLSYSFCRLLARRYFRFACVEQGDAELRNLVLTTQLHSDYKRAFTLVEVQLAFLHDHFFTDYPDKIGITGLILLKVSLIVWGAVGFVCIVLGCISSGLDYVRAIGALAPTVLVVVLVLPLVVSLLELLPMFYPILLPNYWYPVRQFFINGYPTAVTTPASGWHSLLRYYCQEGSKLYSYYWRNKMGQYSLLADYEHPSLKKACINWIEQRLLSDNASPGLIKQHHPTEEDDVSVPDSVRRLVAFTLQQPHMMSGPPTKGTASLRRNRDLLPGGDLLWTCEKATSHTQIILVWHIATCYCDMFPVAVAEVEGEARDHHEVATSLSKYCAYLVAFLPKFLPEHKLTSVAVLQNVLQSAKDILGPTRQRISMEEKLSRIQRLELPEDCPNLTGTDNTFLKGIYLGRKLMELDDASVRWKLIAEFWAETIIYVAPSDDAAAHVEHLAKGGEFVTHLWAMLSNAGILHRAEDDPTPPPPQQHGGVQA